MNRGYFFLYAIVAGLLFTFIIYNINFPERILRYILIALFYTALIIILKNKTGFNFLYVSFISLFIPLIIDASVLVTNKHLIPLRFPFASTFLFFSLLLAYGYYYKNLLYRIIVIIITIGYCIISFNFIIPRVILNMEKEAPIKVNQLFLSQRFINNFGDTVLLKQEMRKVSILDLFFVGCGPCILKEKMYKEVIEGINNPEYRIIYICNGNISSFENFIEYNRKHISSLRNVIYLYDFENNIENYIPAIKGYPFEMILYRDQLIKQYSGFNNESYRLHFEDRLFTIKKYLNEK